MMLIAAQKELNGAKNSENVWNTVVMKKMASPGANN